MTAYVGVSGWSYKSWRGHFYPAGLRVADELSFAAQRLNSIELNGTFYSLRKPEDYRKWASQVPDGFIFAVKGGRYITHMKKLVDVESALSNFFKSGPCELGAKLGPVLWQLPERLSFDPVKIRNFLALLPRELRHALEVRSQTFCNDQFADILNSFNVACVWADSAGTWPMVLYDTADFRYVRLHGTQRLYGGTYTDSELAQWAARIDPAGGKDVYVYFDNDSDGCAPFNAMSLAAMLGIPAHA